MLRRAHYWVGFVGLLAFLGTGIYMDRVHDHLRAESDVVRMLFRSDHIYLLLSSIVNAMLGLYIAVPMRAWRRALQWIGSIALLAGPAMFLIAFYQEPWLTGLARPWTRPGLFMALGGCVLHLIANAGRDAGYQRMPLIEIQESNCEFQNAAKEVG